MKSSSSDYALLEQTKATRATLVVVMAGKDRVSSAAIGDVYGFSNGAVGRHGVFKLKSSSRNRTSPSQSEEDLLQHTGKDQSAPIRTYGKSDSLSDLCPVSWSGESSDCLANTLILLGGSTSAPALTNPVPCELPLKRVTYEKKSVRLQAPIIVIDEPSDEEDNGGNDDQDSDSTGSDMDLDRYYANQEVLSEWEEILQDLRVTEL
ncbi:hypothetical protein ElyMa_004508200 [Elysia marginata]|uniref:Uncharacterized protein n=1 Tax=Elysia marginata TaxID=1093978 RepID=A0AAV4HQ27_9GAST|nr:hypothetical protein ElyMa_004508200 [Elysia marginata]